MPAGRLSMALVILLCGLTSAAAAPRLSASRPAPSLVGWVSFCQQNASECEVNLAEPEIIALEPTTLELIQAVNQHVNRAIAPRRDLDHWNEIDRWDLPTDGEGDCEDYQLLKRKLLAEAGLPRRAMRMTVVIDAAGEGHAVLTIRTDRGDLIMDNNVDAVLPWHEMPYRFIKRESAVSMGWLLLEREAPLVVASAQ
jgi:predicted transglutaminase-like cysteine proteinase